jgi:hypothetical protein
VDNLRKQHVIVIDRCCMCKRNVDSVDHLLLHCEVACAIWNVVFFSFLFSFLLFYFFIFFIFYFLKTLWALLGYAKSSS